MSGANQQQSIKWQVKISDEAAKYLHGKELTEDDKVVIISWAKLVAANGPDKVRERPDVWNDHPLTRGQWIGYRASNFSGTGRIIYKVEANIVTVVVARITPDHDYK